MEQKRISCGSVCGQLPTISVMEDAPIDGKCIRGCFHGWVILSNQPHNVMWSLWNPVNSKTIRLPPLILKDGDFESIKQCCLSSPPSDPTSVLMLTRTRRRTIVFCRLHPKRKRLRWKEMSYAKQLSNLYGGNGFLHCLTCFNGKVYALIADQIVIQVDIVVKNKEVVISLLAFGKLPSPFHYSYSSTKLFLKGYCTDLFYIKLDFDEVAKKTLGVIYLFKWDAAGMIWKETQDLKDAIFFLDLAHECSVFYRHASASELGGFIHILGEMGKVLYSYDIKDKTISLSSLSCLEQSPHLSLWECWLHGDYEKIGSTYYSMMERLVSEDEVDINNTWNEECFEPHLLNIPFDVLKKIMDFCVGVEYLSFRATCKLCHLAAPIIRWSNETSLRGLQTYSLISPWLIVLDKHRGIITFTCPMRGDKYYIKTPQELIGDLQIRCSRYGWLLLYKHNEPRGLFFFNPFTNYIRKLPGAVYLHNLFFSAPPTSPDCIILGLSRKLPSYVLIYCVTWVSWIVIPLDFGSTTPHSLFFPTFCREEIHCLFFPAFCGENVYALNQGALNVFTLNEQGNSFRNVVVAEAPRGRGSSSALYFLLNCDQHLLLVVMDEFGEFVEVFKWNVSTQEWEKMDSLGRHVIYICGPTCLCMEAKAPEMENKIYFPRLQSKSGEIVFYSLETCTYHTIKSRNIHRCLGDFFGTKYHIYPHAWIEPSWS